MAIVKLIEPVGTSPASWEDAARRAIAEASSETVRDITGLHVVNQTATVEDGEIVECRANIKIAFKVESERD